MIRRLVRIAAAFALVTAAAGALAQSVAPVVLRYAVTAPEKSVYGQQLARFAQAVAEETGGSVKIDVYYGGQLGKENDTVQQIARGRIDAGSQGIIFWSTLVPELQLLLLPMYFRSPAELDCTIDNGLAETVARRLEAKGVHVLGWGDGSTLEIVGKRPFTSPADLAGAKAGTYGSRLGVLMWQALGAHATPTSFAELAPGFQTGLLDVSVTIPAFYVPTGLNKIAPVMTRLDLYFTPSLGVVSQAAWERLTRAQRDGLLRAAQRVPVAQRRAEVREFQQRMLDLHVASGGQLALATPAQREAFRKVLAAAWPQMAREAGPDGPAFFVAMEAARKACEEKL
jgi:TRAP-type C4-dicarboxylate transport system substrate-binding protein